MTSRQKAVLLLSAGLDSTVNLFAALNQQIEIVLALTFDYGQRAAESEVKFSAKLAEQVGVPHKIINLTWFKDFNKSSLLVTSEQIPQGKGVAIDNLQVSKETAKSVWVPNRNGIFVNIAAGFAEALGAEIVIVGFNAEEAVTFPDNSEDFMRAVSQSLTYSTANKVSVQSYTSQLNKSQIVSLGESLQVPWSLIWPCYFSSAKWCGMCESCQRAKRAFQSSGVPLPINFQEE